MSSRGSWPIRGRAPPEWWAGSQRVEEIVVCRSPFIHPRQVITMRGGRAAARRSVEKVEEMFLSVFMGRDVRSQMLICLLTSPLPVPPPPPRPSPSRPQCFLLCFGSRSWTSDVNSLLKEEPKNDWTPQKTRTPPQEPRRRLRRGRGVPELHWPPAAAPDVSNQAEEETPEPPQQLHLRQRQ